MNDSIDDARIDVLCALHAVLGKKQERNRLVQLLRYDYDEEAENPIHVSLDELGFIDLLLGIPREKVLCIDVETTGVSPSKDEVLRVSACDGNCTILLDSLVKPERRVRWPEAEEINQISPSMVKDAPSLIDLSYAIEEIMNDCELLIGYNVRNFDLKFLANGRVNIPQRIMVYDLMPDCSVMFGKWSEYHEDYSYVKLQTAANKYGITYKPHDSSEDVVATTNTFYSLLNDSDFIDKVAKREQSTIAQRKKDYTRRLEIERIKHETKRAPHEKTNTTQTTHTSSPSKKNTTASSGCGCLLVIVFLIIMLSTCGRH